MRHKTGTILVAVIGLAVLVCLVAGSPAVCVPDTYLQINVDGFGQGGAVAEASSSMLFNNVLYVGTRSPSVGGQVWRYASGSWELVADGGFGDAGNVAITSMCTRSGELYAGTENAVTGGEVWSYDGSRWIQRCADGLGSAANTRISFLLNYYDLYAGTQNASAGCEVWRMTSSGWTRMVQGGFGSASNTCASAGYCQNSTDVIVGTENSSSGCEVYKYSGGWRKLADGGLGDANNTRISAAAYYGGKCYFSTRNAVTGTEVWRWYSESWSQVNQEGFGTPANTDCSSLATWDSSSLVAGTANPSGFEMWRFDGSQWVRTVGGGGNDADNTEALCMSELGNKRYVGTANSAGGCQVLEDIHPRILSIAPSQGYRGQTLEVAITGEGTHFVDGVSRAWFSRPDIVTVNSTTVTDATHATASITLSGPTNYSAAIDVSVVTDEEAPCRLQYGFSYRGPTISQVSPDSGARGQTLDVTIRGSYTGFRQGGSAAVFSGTGITVNSTTVVDQTTAVANITLAQDVEKVSRDVNVITDGDLPAPRTSYFAIRYPAITVVDPSYGDQGATLYLDIRGTDCRFSEGQSSVSVSGEGVSVLSTGCRDSNHVVSRISVARDAPVGPRDVTVVTGSDLPTPLAAGFTVRHVSRIASVSPDNAAVGQTLDVDITGEDTWFETGKSAAVFGHEGITVNRTTVVDQTHAVANITIGGGVPAGWVSVNVVTEGDTCIALTNGFSVRHPSVASISPSSGAQGRTLEITVLGNSTLFIDGLSRAEFDPPTGLNVKKTTVIYGGKAVVEVEVASNAPVGPRSLNVITGDEVPVPLARCFTVTDPRIVSVSPSQVNQGGTYEITIKAKDIDFPPGRCTPTFSGKGIKVLATTAEGDTVITRVEIATNAPHGPRDVGVLVEDGDQPDPLPGALLVRYCDSRVTSISPASGRQNTKVDVVVTASASRFQQGQSEVYVTGFGVLATRNTVLDATHIKATLSIQPGAELGARNISVEGPCGARQLKGAFEVTSGVPHLKSVSPLSGAPGDVITVTGDGFGEPQESSRVDFGEEHSPSYVEWTYTRIKCVVPPGAASGPLRVRTFCGTSGAKYFTVTNTRKGSNITVTPEEGITVRYEQVTASGQTDSRRSGEPRLAGFKLASGSTRDISSDVTFLGKATVTMPLPKSGFSGEERKRMVILHEENGRWVDRTVERDLAEGIIVAEVSSFSRFAVACPYFASTWYLAEGSTGWGFDCYLSMVNPNSKAVTAQVTFMTEEGPVRIKDIRLPAQSQVRVNPRQYLGATDFSTKVVCREQLPITVDRTMSWKAGQSGTGDAHSSVGVNFPERVWYLAEGSSDWGFECWLLIQNPGEETAHCQVTYMTEGAGARTVEKVIPPFSRRTYDMALDIGPRDASITVVSDAGVIAERAMYRNGRREGHESIGVNSPACDYYLPEGATAWGFTTYVLVQNPGATPANVDITYMTPAGPFRQPAFTMEPCSRRTVRVNDIVPDKDVSTMVHADVPIIAERAMYWGAGTPAGEACHDSVGMPDPHTAFYFPDGQTGGGCETWTLVQNPNPEPVTIEIQYLTGSGKAPLTLAVGMDGDTRQSFAMSDAFRTKTRASIVVRCLTPRKKVMAERSMYWNNRTMGTDTIGGCSD